jgi:hypothetical protein
MKTTCLIYQDQNSPEKGLMETTKENLHSIIIKNRGLSQDQRRYFIKDCFEDNGILDCMYIETSKDYYNKWNAEHTMTERNRKYGQFIQKLSLDAEISDSESGETSLMDTISDGFSIENEFIYNEMMEELHCKLSVWKPWANEMLNYILSDQEVEMIDVLSKKYNISKRTIWYRKTELKKIIYDFLKYDFTFEF